jgi:hypothetical protein
VGRACHTLTPLHRRLIAAACTVDSRCQPKLLLPWKKGRVRVLKAASPFLLTNKVIHIRIRNYSYYIAKESVKIKMLNPSNYIV